MSSRGLLLLALIAVGACHGGPGEDVDAGAAASNGCDDRTAHDRCFFHISGGGCNDSASSAVCQEGDWVCPQGTVPASECGGCFGKPPPAGCVCHSGRFVCPDAGRDAIDEPRTADAGPDAGPDTGTNPCAACAADEICVQINDSSTICHSPTPLLLCQKVSAACAASLVPGQKNCRASSPACELELCGGPGACTYGTPCGNESPLARVYCYGP